MDETELIKRSQRGDAQAFNFLIQWHQKEVLNLAVRMLGNLQDAEDVCQDSWLAAWKSIKRFRGGSLRSWLLHVVSNKCRDEFRRRKKRARDLTIDSPYLAATDSKTNAYSNQAIVEGIQKALLQLPYEQRLAITLRDFNGLSYDEIAGVMKCSTGTIKSRLNRGRINLRNLLRDRGFEE